MPALIFVTRYWFSSQWFELLSQDQVLFGCSMESVPWKASSWNPESSNLSTKPHLQTENQFLKRTRESRYPYYLWNQKCIALALTSNLWEHVGTGWRESTHMQSKSDQRTSVSTDDVPPEAQVCKDVRYPPPKDYSLILRNKVAIPSRTR